MRTGHRLRTAGLLLAILIVGFGIIIVATERDVGAGNNLDLLTADEVIRAMAEHGLVLTREDDTIRHPLLNPPGSRLRGVSVTVDIYVHQSVAERFDDEQRLQRSVLQLQTLEVDGDQPIRITSARNVLILFHAETPAEASQVYAASRALTSEN